MANYDLTYEGSEVQKILDTGDELQTAGYIFRGEATPSTVPGTPTERVAYIGGPGTYTNFGTSTEISAGCIGVFKYNGSAWSIQVINTGLSAAISSEAESRANADGQLQNAISAINTKIGNGYVYAGVATPSTSPVIGKVFYLAITAGTYTNFEDSEETPLAVTAGINILKNTGTGWVLDQVIAIDTEPTQGSDNLVKSGGVLNSIIQNGPAFDLSAYNAQEGVLATYADLNAALTALNALPADFKKGGMSMKFVLSYDNKYVQWRFKLSTFTTEQFIIENNWECSNYVVVSTQSNSDLDVTDEQGNILVEFKNGNVRTKNFNSGQDATEDKRGLMSASDKTKLNTIEPGAEVNDVETENQSSSDLDVTDEQGNILARFSGGHVKTKNFDSSNTEAFKYSDAPDGNCEFFTVAVDTALPNTTDATLSLQDSENLQNDKAAIYFPVTYNKSGKPTRLIIFCFSTGSSIAGSTSSNIEGAFPETKIALGEGYACLAVNGTPGTNNPSGVGNNGTIPVLRSIIQAYKYVVNKYNIAKDGVFTAGFSQGTVGTLQLNMSGTIPVIASAVFGPSLELWKLEYTGKDSSVRNNMLDKFGMVEKEACDAVKQMFPSIYGSGGTVTRPTTFTAEGAVPSDYEKAFILNNIEKWVAYNPMTRFIRTDDIFDLYTLWYPKGTDLHNDEGELYSNISICLPHPIKLFYGTLDQWGITRFAKWFYDAAIRGGSNIEKREYEGQPHSHRVYNDIISFNSKYAGTMNVHASGVECIRYFNRFNF